MNEYLFYAGTPAKGAILRVPRKYTPDKWYDLRLQFAAACGHTEPNESVIRCIPFAAESYEDCREGNVVWYEELYSSDGMAFTLIPLPGVKADEIKRAKSWLKSTRDAAMIRVVNVKKWIEHPNLEQYQVDPSSFLR